MSKEDELYSKKLLETFKQLADADKQKKLAEEAQKPDFGQNLYDQSQELLKSATQLQEQAAGTQSKDNQTASQTQGTAPAAAVVQTSTNASANSTTDLKDEIA